jgi:hypothetical protein
VVVVVVVVRPSAGMRKAGEWVRTEMTATERPGSVSGGLCENAMGEGGQGWWDGGVVVVVVRPSGGMRQGGGFVPKWPKPSECARFRARRVKRQWEIMGGSVGASKAPPPW